MIKIRLKFKEKTLEEIAKEVNDRGFFDIQSPNIFDYIFNPKKVKEKKLDLISAAKEQKLIKGFVTTSGVTCSSCGVNAYEIIQLLMNDQQKIGIGVIEKNYTDVYICNKCNHVGKMGSEFKDNYRY